MNGPPTPPLAPGELPSDPVPTPIPAPVVPSETTTEAPAHADSTTTVPTAQTAPSAPAVQGNNTLYFAAFAQISTLAKSGDFKGMVDACERAELEEVHEGHPTHLLTIVPLFLGYLILDDMTPAQRAIFRVPRELSFRRIIQTLLALLAALWERKYQKVYAVAEGVIEEARKDDFLGADEQGWGVVAGLATAFIEAFRTRTLALLSKSYTSIPLRQAQIYLGLPPDQLLTAIQQRGWQYDATSQVITPVTPRAEGPRETGSIPNPSTLSTLDAVASSVAQLEE